MSELQKSGIIHEGLLPDKELSIEDSADIMYTKAYSSYQVAFRALKTPSPKTFLWLERLDSFLLIFWEKLKSINL